MGQTKTDATPSATEPAQAPDFYSGRTCERASDGMQGVIAKLADGRFAAQWEDGQFTLVDVKAMRAADLAEIAADKHARNNLRQQAIDAIAALDAIRAEPVTTAKAPVRAPVKPVEADTFDAVAYMAERRALREAEARATTPGRYDPEANDRRMQDGVQREFERLMRARRR